MRLRVGTSGFSYPAWVGPFYPEGLAQGRFLPYYAERLDAVEINNSFYRVPATSVVEGWRDAVPPDFRIVLKVARRVTHSARLSEKSYEPMEWMWRAAEALGDRRGPLLLQLPPNLKAEPERLAAFLERLPEGARPAFEFRHPSWHAEETLALLRERGATLCIADADDDPPPPERLPVTAPFGYLRLRRQGYTPEELDVWARRIRDAGWEEAYVFFKHEDAGAGPALALALRERFEALS